MVNCSSCRLRFGTCETSGASMNFVFPNANKKANFLADFWFSSVSHVLTKCDQFTVTCKARLRDKICNEYFSTDTAGILIVNLSTLQLICSICWSVHAMCPKLCSCAFGVPCFSQSGMRCPILACGPWPSVLLLDVWCCLRLRGRRCSTKPLWGHAPFTV